MLLLLIDGYNLLHAIGWASPKLPKGRLEAARHRLLDWLAGTPALKSGTARFLVVFDAQKGPLPSMESDHRGVRVRFAYRQTADDVIEELLNVGPNRDRVVVVSNDNRLHESARRADADPWSCERFLDWLLEMEQGNASATSPEGEKPDVRDSALEREELLRVFSVPKPKRKG